MDRTLGLKIDDSGFLTSSRNVTGALFGMGASAAGTEAKVRQFATQGTVALGQLASSGVRDLGSLLRSVSGLGFAIGPIAGTLGLAVAGIGTAFFQSQRDAKEAQEKMLEDLRSFVTRYSVEALKLKIAIIEGRQAARLGQINAMPDPSWTELVVSAFTGVGGTIEDRWRDAFATRGMTKEFAQDAAFLNELRTQLNALTQKSALEKTKEDAEAAARALQDMVNSANQLRDKSFNFSMNLGQGLGQGFADRDKEDDEAKVRADKERMDAERRRMDADRERRLRQMREDHEADNTPTPESIAALQQHRDRQSLFLGTVSGVLSHAGGPIGGTMSGVAGALMAGAGPAGIAAGAFQGLVGSLIGLGDSAERAREAMEQLRIAHEAFIDSVLLGLGDISPTEFDIRETEREFDARRKPWEDLIERYMESIEDTFTMSSGEAAQRARDELQRKIDEAQREIDKLDELESREKERIESLDKEADALERLNSALRNSPTGFFVEAYLGRHADRAGIPGDLTSGGIVRPPVSQLPTGNGVTFTGQTTITVVLPAGSTADQVTAFTNELARRGMAQNGIHSRAVDVLQ